MAQDFLKLRRKLESHYFTVVSNLNAPPMQDYQTSDPDKWLGFFDKKDKSDQILAWFRQFAPLKNEENLTLTKEEFYQMYCCDKQWAIDLGFCKKSSDTKKKEEEGGGGGGGTITPKPKPTITWNDVDDVDESELESCDFVIKRMDKGDIVETIQERLAVWGYKDFSKSQSPDGKFGKMTQKMVMDFQREKMGKSSPSGKVGCETWKKLKGNPEPTSFKADFEDVYESRQLKLKGRSFISEEEKRNILSKHNSLREMVMGSKFILKEQTLNPEELIPKGIELGCSFLQGFKKENSGNYAKIADKDDTKGNFKKGDYLRIYKPVDVTLPQNFLVFKLIQGKSDEWETKNSYSGEWTCKKLQEFISSPLNLNIQQWKQNNNAMSYEEAKAFRNTAAPGTFKEVKGPDGKTYYTIEGLATANVESQNLTPRQRDVIDYYRQTWLDKGFQEWRTGDAANTLSTKAFSFVEPPYRAGWNKELVPGSVDRGFTSGLYIWVNPNYSNQILDVDLESLSSTAENLEVGFKECQGLVRRYYQMYQQRTRLKQKMGICDLKEKLIACKSEHCRPGSNQGRCGGQGGLRSRDFENLMDFFSGFTPKGDASGENPIPASVGRSIWYLPPPDSYNRESDPNCK